MKYVLKKDLPFAKAGAKLFDSFFHPHELCVLGNDNKERFVCYDDKCFIDLMIEKGWIEEVKPRLFFIELFKDSGEISCASFNAMPLREDAKFTIVRAMEVL